MPAHAVMELKHINRHATKNKSLFHLRVLRNGVIAALTLLAPAILPPARDIEVVINSFIIVK